MKLTSYRSIHYSIHCLVKINALLGIVAIGLLSIGSAAHAEQVSLKVCMNEMTAEMGLTPDLAYKECQRRTIVNCITNLRGKRQVLTASSQLNGRYVVDIGNDKKLWQEGQWWRARGCDVDKKWALVRKDFYDKNYMLQRGRFFRHGKCKTESIQGFEYTDQLAFQQCDPGGYIIDSRRNETDKSQMEQLVPSD